MTWYEFGGGVLGGLAIIAFVLGCLAESKWAWVVCCVWIVACATVACVALNTNSFVATPAVLLPAEALPR